MNKLDKLKIYIPKHQNGAKLKEVETSVEENILPTGELHKNKHVDFGIDNITKKGIPVIEVKDDSAETIQEIQQQAEGGNIQQTAEIERDEIIFNKELTDYVEENRKLWKSGTEKEKNDICLEVGKRIVKEILFNTKDESGLINKMETNI